MLHTSQHSLPTPQSLVVNSGYSVSLNNIRAIMLHGLPLPSSTGCISNYSSSADHCAGVWGGSGPECSWSSTDSRLQHRTTSSRAKRYCGCTAVQCTVYTVQYGPRLLRCTAPECNTGPAPASPHSATQPCHTVRLPLLLHTFLLCALYSLYYQLDY